MEEPEPQDRREIWGDEPEERDASATVAEFAPEELVVRWHDHWAFVPFKVVWRFIRRSGKRIAVTVLGFAVLLAGVAMLVLPGPGWAAIFLGLAILATEYVWAQRLLKKAKEKAGQARDAVLGRKNGPAQPGATQPGAEQPSATQPGPEQPGSEQEGSPGPPTG
jgi:uncharacterized protein (TIGR02611 family)